MLAWFRRRDAAIYPKDELGDALYEQFPSPDKMPDMAVLWYDIYFGRKADADAMAGYLEDRRLEILRDHEEDPGGGVPSWNIEVDFPVKPRHLELKLLHAEVQQRIREFNGQLGSWLLKNRD